jgi:hypothetical protein
VRCQRIAALFLDRGMVRRSGDCEERRRRAPGR